MSPLFTSDRQWDFPVGVAELWDAVARTGEYRRWWPWLRRFDATGGLEEGARWDCHVQPPLPYAVRFTVVLRRVDRPTVAEAVVTGDITGTARLELAPSGAGSTVHLVSSLAPQHRLLLAANRLARPLVQWGHDWVLDQGAQQFVRRALDDASSP